ncbi:OmpA family protein [Carboxylicivirga sp. N1Y90]|uniref:OmpA family protein n=1 Tax=Carboxylicivirga fragile TaxID=3417571 RepID=UPI003D343018|nr:PD40 domain-containing protein [Marinilabiliaceae bacterium N1Y90]
MRLKFSLANVLSTLILLMVVCIPSKAQKKDKWSLHTKSKKAVAIYTSATEMYTKDKVDEALGLLDDAIKKDKNFIDAYLLKADIYFRKAEYEKEIACIERAIAIDSTYFVSAFYNMGVAKFNTGEYAVAIDWLNRYKAKTRSKRSKAKADAYIVKANFADKAIKNPVPFEPINMGDKINSNYDEYWPSISADGEHLIYTVLVPRNEQAFIEKDLQKNVVNFREDFYTSYYLNADWTDRVEVVSINTDLNEGAQTLSADGNWMFFTACGRNDTKGSCDIYFSKRTIDGWSKPVNIGGPVNSPFWESQPCFSADGRTLFFVSSRPGGIGQKDIWKSRLIGYKRDGSPFFGEPENLGSNVNTSGNENSPFIHHDNQTLYFSSDTWPGMGKMDLFLTRLKANGDWQEPQNLGYPLNTSNDEIGLVINAKGDMAFFSSDGLSEKNTGKDIYKFEMPQEIRPIPAAYVKGRVFDKDTKEQLNAYLKVNDIDEAQTVVNAESTDFSGEFLFCLASGKQYGLSVEKEGYLFYSSYFNVADEASVDNPQVLDVYLSKIKAGERIILRNVFFETDSYLLAESSNVELDQVIKLLQLNESIKVEIGGHTDNVGSVEYNKQLAKRRAKQVYDYLIAGGIAKEQLSYKGYGQSQAIDSNDTEEGRAKNRRTEVKIL